MKPKEDKPPNKGHTECTIHTLVSERGQPLYKGQTGGSQWCPLIGGSTVVTFLHAHTHTAIGGRCRAINPRGRRREENFVRSLFPLGATLIVNPPPHTHTYVGKSEKSIFICMYLKGVQVNHQDVKTNIAAHKNLIRPHKIKHKLPN